MGVFLRDGRISGVSLGLLLSAEKNKLKLPYGSEPGWFGFRIGQDHPGNAGRSFPCQDGSTLRKTNCYSPGKETSKLSIKTTKLSYCSHPKMFGTLPAQMRNLLLLTVKLVDQWSIYRSTASIWRWRAVLPLGMQAACEPSASLIPDKPERD